MTTFSCAWGRPPLRSLRRALFFLCLISAGSGLVVSSAAQVPQWWETRGVLTNAMATNDYAPANAGQLKHVAWQAYYEMQAKVAGGSGSDVSNMVYGLPTEGNFVPINIGQLKYVVQPFYARLIEVEFTNAYPWETESVTNNYVPANIGQLKHVFSFDMGVDSDADGMPDGWETEHFGGATSGISSVDSDSDGLSNLEEFYQDTDPNISDTDGDDIPDGWEVANGFDPQDLTDALDDPDGDCMPNLWEFAHDTDPADPDSVPDASIVVAIDGSGDYLTLPDAFNASEDLDIINVKAGIYSDKLKAYSTKRIVWRAQAGPGDENRVILQNSELGKATVSLYSDTIMTGFVITHAEGITGRGVYATKHYLLSRTPTIRLINCGIHGNEEYDSGAAVYNSSVLVELIHCTIIDNKATSYSLIYNGTQTATTRINNSIIWNEGQTPDELRSGYTYIVSNSIIRGGQFGGLDSNPYLTRSGWLTCTSPAINQALFVVGKDIHDEDRPVPTDMGWDEFIDDDDDGLPDWMEILNFGDLISATGSGDNDSDGLTNIVEYLLGTDLSESDTDGDGLNDSEEINVYNTDPLDFDTDGDGMSDGWEEVNGFDPLDPTDASPDADSDGISNLCEYKYSTDPNSSNSVPVIPLSFQASVGDGYIKLGENGNYMSINLLRGDGELLQSSEEFTVRLDGNAIFDASMYLYGSGVRDLDFSRMDITTDHQGRFVSPVTALHPGTIDVKLENWDSACAQGLTFVSSNRLTNAYVQAYNLDEDWLRLSISNDAPAESVSMTNLCGRLEPGIIWQKRPIFSAGSIVFNNLFVYKNGYVSLNSAQTVDPAETNSANIPSGIIAPFLQDLFMGPQSCVLVDYEYDSHARCVIEWHKMALASDHDAQLSFQLHLTRTNVLPRIVYKEWIPGTNSAVSGAPSFVGMKLGAGHEYVWTNGVSQYSGLQVVDTLAVQILAQAQDADADGVVYETELLIGTDPINPDTNGDGMSDGWKYTMGLLPLSTNSGNGPNDDPDSDGYINNIEFFQNSDPYNPCSPVCDLDFADTNRNGMADLWEVQYSVQDDPLGDPDYDGFNNLQEYLLNQSPSTPNGVVTNALY